MKTLNAAINNGRVDRRHQLFQIPIPGTQSFIYKNQPNTSFMRKHILMLALAVVSLASCKKDKGDPNGPDPNGPGPDPDPVPTAKVLKKYTETEGGQSTVYNLTYSNKLLAAISSADQSDVTNFSYDGNGNVTKMENNSPESHTIYAFEYENGQPVRGSLKHYNLSNGAEELVEDDVIHFTVENNQVTKINMDMNVVQREVNFELSYENGNLKKIQGLDGLEYSAEFSYGTKKSPYPKVFKFMMDYVGVTVPFFAKNDLKTQHYDFPGTDNDFTTTMENTYDANGYVISATDGTSTYTYEYQ
jgi:hypothetical protein